MGLALGEKAPDRLCTYFTGMERRVSESNRRKAAAMKQPLRVT